MQSIYWVLTWACHRKCVHCYDDRFRPYVRDALSDVVEEGQKAFEAIIDNLPDDLTWFNPDTGKREATHLILAGGELLIPGVREELFYPVLAKLKDRYGANGPKLSIQTTGDVLTAPILDSCLAMGVTGISIASIDDYHVGMTGDKKFKFMEKIRSLMASRGVREISLGGEKDARLNVPDAPATEGAEGPNFLFFGAQPDLWIGELWPRGRAFVNGLSKTTYETNFCNMWSGGRNFLKLGDAGSEISIEPNGNVFPCCLKTKTPIGNLTEEPLQEIFESVATLPAIQAINSGTPDRMGAEHGWDPATFRKNSSKTDGTGRVVENMCLGCDSYFDAHLTRELRALRSARLAKRAETKNPKTVEVTLGL